MIKTGYTARSWLFEVSVRPTSPKKPIQNLLKTCDTARSNELSKTYSKPTQNLFKTYSKPDVQLVIGFFEVF